MVTTTTCRSCGHGPLTPILSLGVTPLADALLTEEQLTEPEITAPLDWAYCPHCALLQITESVDPEILFGRDYPYYSSVSRSLLAHFRASAEELIARRGLTAASRVVEAASNDGYMLKVFAEAGIPVLGIDPADGPARAAQQAGIPTLIAFFGTDLARRLRDEQGVQADLFLANNVLAHVPDVNGFVEGARILLKDTLAAHALGSGYAVLPEAKRAKERWNFQQVSAKLLSLDLAEHALSRNCNRGLTSEVLLLDLFDCSASHPPLP